MRKSQRALGARKDWRTRKTGGGAFAISKTYIYFQNASSMGRADIRPRFTLRSGGYVVKADPTSARVPLRVSGARVYLNAGLAIGDLP